MKLSSFHNGTKKRRFLITSDESRRQTLMVLSMPAEQKVVPSLQFQQTFNGLFWVAQTGHASRCERAVPEI